MYVESLRESKKAQWLHTLFDHNSQIQLFLMYKIKFILGPVVQNFVRLTVSLNPQFVNCISTSKANTLLLFVEKDVRMLVSHFFQQKITVYLKYSCLKF